MSGTTSSWLDGAVVYQIYPRSFQDSNGDGIGDLAGIASRLDHLEWLGVDAIWLSPFYPSPQADMGYDVSDHTNVAPEMGTLADFDLLLEAAHQRGIRVLLDLIPGHTSIEHPWFREHPEYYLWADDGPPNNWISGFGGPAWTRDEETGRWYFHAFYPEQPYLNWRVPEVREAMSGVMRFWLDRGVDGFRVDAVQAMMADEELRDDPPASGPPPLPLGSEYETLDHIHSEAGPDISVALDSMRKAAGDSVLIGEVYRPTAELGPYAEYLDWNFGFDLLHSAFEPERIARAVAEGVEQGGIAWALSNHDFPRLATRFGPEHAALAAVLLLTLPGPVFLYQGDEIGMVDGPGGDPPIDRTGRDAHRHPMQWTADPDGGFTSGSPYLPLTDPAKRSVAGQAADEDSVLSLHRRLIALRREIHGDPEIVRDGPVLEYRRGTHIVALNFSDDPQPGVPGARLVLSTEGEMDRRDELAPREGAIFELA